ncbi:MAG: DUF3142 domain-containing protein [Opitutia bacterium]
MVCLTPRTPRLLAGALAALLLAACGPAPRPQAARPLDHAAYVWAPKWGPETSLAVGADRLPAEIARLRVYVGATHFLGEPQAFPVEWAALARSGRALTLVVASGPAAANFRDAPDLSLPGNLLAEALAAARAVEAKVDRVQFDLECPPAKLGGYARQIEAVRRRFPGLEVSVSVLPSWLDEPSLGELLAAADRFTLHLSPGYVLGGARARTDFKAAERWVAQAASHGRPFRVGLPITSHYLCLDPNGGLLASVPVGRPVPAGTVRTEPVVADPAALPAFVRLMATHSPAQLEGFDWLRLPVPGDAGTWSLGGMTAALRGEPVVRSLKVAMVPDEGYARVVVVNDGMVPMPSPTVRVSWKGGEVQACDGAGGWEMLLGGGEGFRLRPGDTAGLIPAGETLTAGWIRFASPPTETSAALAER